MTNPFRGAPPLQPTQPNAGPGPLRANPFVSEASSPRQAGHATAARSPAQASAPPPPQQPQPQSQPQQPQSQAAAQLQARDQPTARVPFGFQWDTPAPKQPIQESPDVPLPPFRIGMTIDNDRIKLLDFVGQGSFAHVYLGYDYSTSSKCAVKCLLKAGADPKKMSMQKREVKAMEDLHGHPNVIGLIRTVESSEWLLIIMEFCQIDLYEAIMQKGGFPDFAVKDVFSQLCDGVMHCHSRGYYHRDLKPENVLLDISSLTAKITDFGLATRDTWCYEMGCADPTKGYSPIASDVWALGILLINLLFSKNPWFEATMTDPIFSIYVTSRPDILRHHFKISAEFDSILQRVFNLDPSKRLPLPEFKRLVNALPSFLEEDLENTVPQHMSQIDENQQEAQAPPQRTHLDHATLPTPPLPKTTNNPFGSGKNSFGSGKHAFGSGKNTFGSSKMQGPLVVFGSIPDSKDPKNPFNSNPRASPMNFTSSDINPFSSANAFTYQRNDTPEQEAVNPFFAIPADGSFVLPVSPTAIVHDPASQHHPHWPQNIQPPSPTLPPVLIPMASENPSLTTLIWTAPARVAAPELPNTLTLGREGIGRIGISRLATAKQKLSSRKGALLRPTAAGNIDEDLLNHHTFTQTHLRPSNAFGLAFLGTAIAGYVNPDADEILEGDELDYDSDELDDDDDGIGASDSKRRTAPPDEESHYEVVKVDRRLIPDLEKGIKRAVNRGMKKFRPFMQLDAEDGMGGAAGDAAVVANLKLGKGVAGTLGAVSTEDWSEFSAADGNQVAMPGSFVFGAERERRRSVPLISQSENLSLSSDLPLYHTQTVDSASRMRAGKSSEDVTEHMTVEDEVRTSRGRRRHETVLAKMYNGLAGMSILGGSRSKSMKRAAEAKGSKDSLPLHTMENSILPPPQPPFAFMTAKVAKSRATEQDFEELVVNAKTTTSGSLPRHRHRVKNKSSYDDVSNSQGRISSIDTIASGFSQPAVNDVNESGRLPNGQFSPDKISPNRINTLTRPVTHLGDVSPNRLTTARMTTTPLPTYPQQDGGRSPDQISNNNPFRPIASTNNNPFQRPASMYLPQTANPFYPDATLQFQQFQQFPPVHPPQPPQPHPRYSTPSASDMSVFVGGYNQTQQQQFYNASMLQNPQQQFVNAPPQESPFKPLHFHHQQPLEQPHQPSLQQPHTQHHHLHTQASMPNISFPQPDSGTRYGARSTTPFMEGGLHDRQAPPRTAPYKVDDAGNESGAGEEGSDESDEESIARRGEDRYGIVRGFGWLVGRGGNNVERSDSHGV
ncbi:hypothetical protein BCR33DRAFT_716800 [Rhizoclosmatium globosum]|uniref:Protein kinase domain-containing protein n=1 Tax=Rhizoclosmatium globosum TaxID=329046 RepID=A0A1Y2CCT2_9FUNG|nr:hypothetical protein BCR33DRAFT_716800 [Rhizoclosmatium globosum]|eukprot:ORY44861.1 hypothetical protein BCR33DRAFT_716800 [Rhizoclosmatium globosum]